MPMPSTDREPISAATARCLYDARYLHQLSSEYSILGDLYTLLPHLLATRPMPALSPAS